MNKKKTVVILNKNPIQKSVLTIDNLKNKNMHKVMHTRIGLGNDKTNAHVL